MPRHPNGGLTLATIGDLIDEGYGSTVRCSKCGRQVHLDLPLLANRLGRDHSYLAPDLKPHLKCSACGSKDMSFSLQTPSGIGKGHG